LKTPVVFICENNLYAQTVAASDVMAITDIADRAAGYGIPGHIVDGQDVVAVHEATQKAVSQARSGEGPTLLECKTYRFKTHYPVFEEVRPPEEIERWLARDPIEILGSKLNEEGQIDDSTIEAMEQAIKKELEEAITTAETAPPPDPKEVFTNLYSEDTELIGL
jgi:TPP-dependent pyruvate/acetoin dehydrogenase alpha subunit